MQQGVLCSACFLRPTPIKKKQIKFITIICIIVMIFLLATTVVKYSKFSTSMILLYMNFQELDNTTKGIPFIERDGKNKYIAFKLKSHNTSKFGEYINNKILANSTSLSKPLETTTIVSSTQNISTKHQTNVDSAIMKPTYPVTILDNAYLINNKYICKDLKNISFLIIVHSATTHFTRRSSIRETWANYNLFKHHVIRIVFLLGIPKQNNTQVLIEHESQVNKDIVQGNFVDTYENLTHKGVLGLRWISENCPHANFVVKLDDDVFVNVYKLFEMTETKLANKTKHMFCAVRPNGTSIIQRTEGKWKVRNEEFKNFTHYPVTYCNGFFVIMTPDIIADMYVAVKETPFFWIDDVYLFGLLPSKLHNVTYEELAHLNLDENYAKSCFDSKEKVCELLVANAYNEGIMDKLWFGTIQQNKNLAQKYSIHGLL